MNDIREMNRAAPWDDCEEIFAGDDLDARPAVGRRAGDREGLRRDVRRIASTLFCSADIDPSIVSFAKNRTAQHWGLPERDVDAMVTARLLEKTASLIRDLRWLGVEHPPVVLA